MGPIIRRSKPKWLDFKKRVGDGWWYALYAPGSGGRGPGAGVVFPGLRRDSDCVSVVPWGPVVKDQGGRLLTRVGGDGGTEDRVVLCTFRHQITALDPVFSASVVSQSIFQYCLLAFNAVLDPCLAYYSCPANCRQRAGKSGRGHAPVESLASPDFSSDRLPKGGR